MARVSGVAFPVGSADPTKQMMSPGRCAKPPVRHRPARRTGVFIAVLLLQGVAFGQTTPFLVKDINRTSRGGIREITSAGSYTIFNAARINQDTAKLWRTDGTPAGTSLLKVFPGSYNGSANNSALNPVRLR